MTTILAPRPAKQVPHQMRGFCEGGHGQAPGKCYDDHGRGKGTCYGARPGLNLGRGNGHVVGSEGLFDPGKAMGLPPAAGAQAVPER